MASVDFLAGVGIGIALMACVTIVATDQLLRHYIRKGWLRFPTRQSN